MMPKTRATRAAAGVDDKSGKGIESYYQQQTAALTKQLETFLQLDDAAENFYEAVKRGGKGLTQSQAQELAALQNTVQAFKALDKAGKGLQSAMDGIKKDVYSGAADSLVKLIQAQQAAPAAITKAREALAAAKLGTDQYAAAQKKLNEETDRYAASGESYQQGLENLNTELGKGVEALRESVAESQNKARVLELEIDGSDDARKALQDLTRQRALDIVQQERDKTLGPLRDQLRQAEADGYGDIAEALKKTIAEYENLYAAKATADVQVVDRERLKADAEEAREAFEEPFREAARSIQSSLADTFENVFRGGIKSFKDLGKSVLDIFIKLAAQVAALLVFQPVMRNVGSALGLDDSFMRSLGVMPAASGGASTGSAGGFSLSSVWNWGSKLFGGGTSGAASPAMGFMDSPAFGGGSLATGAMSGAMSWMPWVGLAMAGKQAFNAMGSTGSKIGMGLLGPSIEEAFANPMLALAPLIGLPFLNMFLNTKPSNKGAEFAFDPLNGDTLYEGTKHAKNMEFVKSFQEPIEKTIEQINKRFGVTAQSGSAIGTNIGVKEGASFYFQPSGGGIDDRQKFEFDKERPEEIQAALDSLMVAYLKGADWSAIGARIGAQSAADVATALENSAASTLDELMADISFAESFQSFVDLAAVDLDPVALAMKQIADAGKTAAGQIGTAVDTFRTKATDLGLGAEVLEGGLTRLDMGTQGLILSMLGLEAELDPVAAATANANAFIAELTPILEAAGFSAERMGEIVDTVFNNMVTSAQQAAAATQIAFETGMLNSLNSALSPGYQPPADSFLYGLVGAKWGANMGPGGGTFAPLVAAIEGARTGDKAALQSVYDKANANVGKEVNGTKVFTQAEAQAVMDFAGQLYTQALARANRTAGGTLPEYNPGSGGSSADAANDNSLRDAIQGQIRDLQDLAKVHQDAARQAERLGNALRDAANGLRLYRLGLLTDPSKSPLSIGDQLVEAQRQQADAFARVLAGGDGAPEAARELQQTTDRVLDLSRQVYGSTKQSGDIFRSSIAMLEQAETASVNYAALQLAAADTANLKLEKINLEIEGLRADLSNIGSPSSPGSPGSPGSPSAPPPTAPGQDLAFGYSNLGRGTGETAQAFMERVFPNQAAKLKVGDGIITEQEGYDWAQAKHASGLNLTNAAYFGAARRAGFADAFEGTKHYDFLSPGGVPFMPRWTDFIDELRLLTSVPKDFFGVPYANGGLVTGGTPGRDSVPAMLMPGERVFSVPHARIIENLAAGRSNDNREVVAELRLLRADNRALRAQVQQVEQAVNSQTAEQATTNNGLRRALNARGEVGEPGGQSARRRRRAA